MKNKGSEPAGRIKRQESKIANEARRHGGRGWQVSMSE